MYVGFVDFEKVYDSVKREAVWQVLRIYDVGNKILNIIKNKYINSLALACVIANAGES